MAYFLAPSLVRLRSEVNALWPKRSKASDGWIGDTAHSARKSDHNPDDSAGGIVRAIDVTNAGIDVDAFVSSVIRDVRTRYVITRGRIWTREAGWRKYTGPNGHYRHVHVSVRSAKSPRYDLQAHAWGLSKTVGNNLGGGGSVTTPNIPGAPAPITPEDDLTPEESRKLNAIFDAIFTGGSSMPGGVPIKDRLESRFNQVDKALASVSKTAAQARDAAGRAVDQTGPIRRASGPVSLRQEVADIKTAVLAFKPGSTAEVDIPALAEALKGVLTAEVRRDLVTRLSED